MNPGKFFSELKRRKVYRLAVAYAVGAWVLAQIVTQLLPYFDVPNWIIRLLILLLALGFPVALILSWAFDFTLQGIKRTDDALPGPGLPDAPEKSIAVLPFENLSDDQQNAYFADGIQDDILSSLAKVADLKVISRTSVRQYRGGARNLREIGAVLGVAHILEGTVRRAGNRVRVNAQLIDARTDAHLWADTFDREMTDLFALQSELAERIAAALRANLSAQEKASLQVHPTADLDAYDLYLRARDLFRWSGAGDPRENGEKALRLLEQALARDPHFALAHTLASRFHAELYWFGYDRTRDRLARAKAEAETALRIRPDLGDAVSRLPTIITTEAASTTWPAGNLLRLSAPPLTTLRYGTGLRPSIAARVAGMMQSRILKRPGSSIRAMPPSYGIWPRPTRVCVVTRKPGAGSPTASALIRRPICFCWPRLRST